MRWWWMFVVIGLLSGCTTATPEPEPEPAAPTAPLVSDQERLQRALLTPEEKARFGLETVDGPSPDVKAVNSTFSLSTPCGAVLRSDRLLGTAIQIGMNAPGRAGVSQVIARYAGTTGAEVVAEVRQSLNCQIPENKYGPTIKVTGLLDLPKDPGVDAHLAYCTASRSSPQADCYLFAGAGEFATVIDFGGWNTDVAAARAAASQLATALTPVLEAAFARI